ncbi:MAG: hypothetical protein WC804_19315 [Sphingomonas sp.]|jgi:hypothetical protein|uniref:hypothetical protein n=1 Tax=Sphingomonas sp. TaxID=28214 RepID=UPI003561D050
MELILLLTAFFSAMTGVITGTRGPDLRPGQAVVASTVVRTAAPAVAAKATLRPSASVAALSNRDDAGAAIVFTIIAAVPLYASRLRV